MVRVRDGQTAKGIFPAEPGLIFFRFLERRVRVCPQLDGPGRTKYWPDSTILQLIADLAELGLAHRILLGGDAGRRSMMRAYGGGPVYAVSCVV